jgi:hypothetical protein
MLSISIVSRANRVRCSDFSSAIIAEISETDSYRTLASGVHIPHDPSQALPLLLASAASRPLILQPDNSNIKHHSSIQLVSLLRKLKVAISVNATQATQCTLPQLLDVTADLQLLLVAVLAVPGAASSRRATSLSNQPVSVMKAIHASVEVEAVAAQGIGQHALNAIYCVAVATGLGHLGLQHVHFLCAVPAKVVAAVAAK